MSFAVNCLVLTLLAATAWGASPREFGRAELQRAIADRQSRGASAPRTPLQESIVAGQPESWTLTSTTVSGSDERGLMYGLLEAADQVRRTGAIQAAKGAPATPIRGIRYFLHNADLERDWYYAKPYWDEYFAMLAMNRFNRFNLVFAHQTDYLAPPYPFWLDLPEFPTIRAKNLTPEQRRKNLEMLQYIAATAVAHGIDFTLGVWEHNIQDYRRPPMVPMTEGLTDDNIGPYSYAALKKILQLVPEISSVQMRTNNESGIPPARQVDFYKNHVFRAIKDAGRPVILDLRGWIVAGGMVQAAKEVGVPVRLSTKYWAEDLGRPYQPAESYGSYSYLNFLEKPRSYGFYWELWGLGSHRLLLWGDPTHVRRAVSTFRMSGTDGFEIDPPLAQKGFGNAPGKWGVFADSQSERMFWKWEFERYWLFYNLWGRISYDPSAPASTWEDQMRQRFGRASSDVMAAYSQASQVMNEIVAFHLADPNMYIWPEINPGGLADSYREVSPSDWRYIAGIPEAVTNRLTGVRSAKQTPEETARRLNEIARLTDEALDRAAKSADSGNREWQSTEVDLRVLANMARYHAHKQRGTYLLTYFDRTRDASLLPEARREFEGALAIWEKLIKLTDGVYPRQMAFGPADQGHWVDKLPYVRHDLELVAQREAVAKKVGAFDRGFDFGGPLESQKSRNAYRLDNYILRNTEAPGFQAVDSKTAFDDKTGYGWLDQGTRESNAATLLPYAIARGVMKQPASLPGDMLFTDSIQGRGAQAFGVKVKDGAYQVRLLHADGNITNQNLTAQNGLLRIAMPEGEWRISGLTLRADGAARTWPKPFVGKKEARPRLDHTAPPSTKAGQPLRLTLTGALPKDSLVRLHYRAVNQMTPFQLLEAAPGQAFTIPGEAISERWDLMYYFEVVDAQGNGWFHPDPQQRTPYYVVTVQK